MKDAKIKRTYPRKTMFGEFVFIEERRPLRKSKSARKSRGKRGLLTWMKPMIQIPKPKDN